jgi:membrane protein implicated in regulation of membrane protease activity
MEYLPSGWHLWVLAAVGAGALELHFGNFVYVWFGLGALGSAVLAALGAPFELQLIGFSVLTGALFLGSRTLFRNLLMRDAGQVKVGADQMVGKEAKVTQSLSDHDGTVRIHGELWAARSLDGPIAEGEPVRVERIDGLTLFVRRPRAALWDPKGS